ncbi:uncharacterized protein LOC114730192 [Neltuma alba]|uniref:uncharacterized protein LOC114730192 n=1 Tax=Neltuma alba TaxID=207710 RepID=UPI0010A4A853|nr:uncharacterized protein LOC114730192 [Prosopis alba]
MYPNTEHILLSTMPSSDLFLAKENPDEDVSIKRALQFQNHHFHESVPNCAKSTVISDLVVLESSTRLENPISDLNQSWFARRNSSQSHSTAQIEKKKEGRGGYEAEDPLLSKDNCKLKVEEQEEENDEEEEREDGFRTPTSLDRRIPEVKQCPPAPRKPKLSLKRKATHTRSSTPLHLSSKEVQLLFPVQHNPLSDPHRSTKKVRRNDS